MTHNTQLLRHALQQARESHVVIAVKTGIPESVLSRFARDQAGLAAKHFDALCNYFGLELKKRKGK